MKGNNIFDEFQKNMQDLIANSPVADLEKNIKSMMAQGFSKMDLVTREEFDHQVALVNSLRDRIASLEAQLVAQSKTDEDK